MMGQWYSNLSYTETPGHYVQQRRSDSTRGSIVRPGKVTAETRGAKAFVKYLGTSRAKVDYKGRDPAA